MLQPFLNSTTLPLLEKVATFAQRRQEVLAGNVANVDTPGYKTRDLPISEFQDALKHAARRITQPNSLAEYQSLADIPWPSSSTSIASFEDLFPRELFQSVEADPHNITFQDGGNRSIEHEMMEMTKNSMLQNFAIELMVAQMGLLQTVISERP